MGTGEAVVKSPRNSPGVAGGGWGGEQRRNGWRLRIHRLLQVDPEDPLTPSAADHSNQAKGTRSLSVGGVSVAVDDHVGVLKSASYFAGPFLARHGCGYHPNELPGLDASDDLLGPLPHFSDSSVHNRPDSEGSILPVDATQRLDMKPLVAPAR